MTTTLAENSRSPGAKYRLSLERLVELNRSSVPLLLARLTSACPSLGKTPADINDPEDLVDEIRAHCADDDDFIRSSMPLQEIVFRTLLLNGGESMALSKLHDELTERWSSPIRPITVTVSGLARVLDSDVFYGFAVVPVEEPEGETTGVPMLAAAGVDDPDLLRDIIDTVAADEDGAGDEDLYDEDDEADDVLDEDDDLQDD
jgi:hypothetical protein